jgi:hypothetical protein
MSETKDFMKDFKIFAKENLSCNQSVLRRSD